MINLTANSSAQMMSSIIMFAAIILIFYFLIIRPQRKRDKETKAMLDAMKKGDKVVSIGGIHGTVVAVKEQTVIVKVDDNTRLEFTKSAISSVVSKDALKQAPKKKEKEAVEEKKEEIEEKKEAEAPAEAPVSEEEKKD